MEEEEEEDTDVGVQLRAKIKASGLPDLSVGSQSEEEGVWGCWEAWGRGRGALARGYARDWWGAAGGAGGTRRWSRDWGPRGRVQGRREGGVERLLAKSMGQVLHASQGCLKYCY